MTVIYGIMMSIVIALFILVFKRALSKGEVIPPVMGLLVGLSYFLILPLCILILNGGYRMPASYGVLGYWGELDLSDPAYGFPFFVIWLSIILTAVVLLAVLPKRDRTIRSAPRYTICLPKLRIVIFICSAILLVRWIVLIAHTGGIEDYLSLHWYSRFQGEIERWGAFFILWQHATGAVQILLTAATALLINAIIQKGARKYGLLVFAFIMMVIIMIMTGNRIYIALLGLYIGTCLLSHRKFKLIFLLMLVLPTLVLFFSTWAHVRSRLVDLPTAITHYEYSRSGESNKLMTTLVDVTEAGSVMLLFHIIRDFGPRYDFLYGETYSRAVTFPIPRSIYPDRAKSFTVMAAELYEPEANTSFSSTVLGEMYANFGIFTVISLPLFSLAILWTSNRVMVRLSQHALLSAVLFMLFAWMTRSVFAANFIAIIFCALIIWGLRFEKGLFYPAVNSKLLHPRLR